jgi:hypothetical protein
LINQNVFNSVSYPVNKSDALTLLILGVASTIFPTIFFSVWDGVFVAIFLFFAFRFFFKKYDRILFTFSFGLYLLNSTFFLFVLNLVNGSPFLSGGDDLFFYDAGKALFLSNYDINIDYEGFSLIAVNYPAYLYLISFFYGFFSFLGFDSLHFYHFTLFKVSLGAIIPVLIFKLRNFYYFNISKVDLIFIILFPTLILQTVSFLRDSLISLFFIFAVYKIVLNKKFIYKFLWMLPFSVILYFFRPLHGFLLIFFFVIYYFFSSKKFLWVKIFSFAFLFIFFVSYFISYFGDFLDQYQRLQGMYSELSIETNQEGSLGVVLYASSFPLIWPFKLLYFYLSPIPPPIFATFNILSIYLSLGSLFWYFIVFGFFKSVLRKVNTISPFYLSLFLLFLVAGIVGVNTSKDPRHLTFLYALIIPFGLGELKLISKEKFYFFIFGALIVGIISYTFLKLLI